MNRRLSMYASFPYELHFLCLLKQILSCLNVTTSPIFTSKRLKALIPTLLDCCYLDTSFAYRCFAKCLLSCPGILPGTGRDSPPPRSDLQGQFGCMSRWAMQGSWFLDSRCRPPGYLPICIPVLLFSCYCNFIKVSVRVNVIPFYFLISESIVLNTIQYSPPGAVWLNGLLAGRTSALSQNF